MKKQRLAILNMVSVVKITVNTVDSPFQALKKTRARLHQLNIRDALNTFTESTHKRLETVRKDNIRNLKRFLREQNRILNRNFRATARGCKQLFYR